MKKSLLYSILVMTLLSASSFTTTINASNVPSVKITLYTMKNHNSKSIHKSKIIHLTKLIHTSNTKTINHKKYQYAKSLHGYLNMSDIKKLEQLDEQLAKRNNKKFENTINHQKTKPAKNTTPKQDKIVNGYDETKETIVDKDTYEKVATQAAIDKLNSFRESKGLQPLTVDPGLSQIAQMRAQEDANYGYEPTNFDGHRTSDGTLLLARDAQQLGIMSYDQAYNSIYENDDMLGIDDADNGTPEEVGIATIQEQLDEGPTGGHYQTDVTPSLTKLGLSIYVKNNSTISMVMDAE